jgi:hypothetical protein
MIIYIFNTREDYIKRKGPQLESIKESKKKKEEAKEQLVFHR